MPDALHRISLGWRLLQILRTRTWGRGLMDPVMADYIVNEVINRVTTAGDYYARRRKLSEFRLVLSPELYQRVEKALAARANG